MATITLIRQVYDGYTDKSVTLLDLPLVEGTMDQVENGSLKASGFQLLVEVTRRKDDHRFSAVFVYESEGWSSLAHLESAY